MRRGRFITIGSFDGVHRGHVELLERAVHEAKKRSLRSLALTFNIPPRMVLNKSHPIKILSDKVEKEFLIKSLGIDEVVFLNFDAHFSKIRPFSFFRGLLINQFKAKGLVVGFDFRFGEGRSAGAIELVKWGQEFEIPVWVIPPIHQEKAIVSSTRIRELMEAGRFQKALSFLGHPYLIAGKIVRGQRVGRKIGFPTTNIQTIKGKLLPSGVFVIRGRPLNLKSKEQFFGVGNIGRRPTLFKNSPVTVEVHWLKGNVPSYGKTIVLELLHRLRPEKKFKSAQALQKAIKQDIIRAQKYVGK